MYAAGGSSFIDMNTASFADISTNICSRRGYSCQIFMQYMGILLKYACSRFNLHHTVDMYAAVGFYFIIDMYAAGGFTSYIR